MATEKKQNAEITEEKKQEYAENRKQKNKELLQQRKEEKEENKTQERRLAFIQNILNSYGVTRNDLARELGNTTQNLYWIFSVRDDCTLSKAEEILAVCNINLEVELKPKIKRLDNREFLSDGITNKIVGELAETSTFHTVKQPKYITDCEKDSRMYFLAEFITENEIDTRLLEKKIESSYGHLRQIFMTDNIYLSMIYKIANATNSEILWKISAKKGK